MTPAPHDSETNLRLLTAREFIEILTLVNEDDYAEFYGPYDDFERAIIIKNVVVEDTTVIVIGSDVIVTLPLIIIGGHFAFFQINGCFFMSSFRLEDCTFRGEFHLTSGDFQGKFLIEDCTFERYFLIEGGTFKSVCRIVRAKSEGYSNIRGGIFQTDFWIERTLFEDLFTIEGGTFQQNFTIVDSTFNLLFSILAGDFQGQFKLIHNDFQESVLVSKSRSIPTFQREFWLEGGTFKGVINYKHGKINHLIFNRLTAKVEIEIFGATIINQVTFRAIIQKDSFVSLTGDFHGLEFDTFQNFGVITLNNVSVKTNPSKFGVKLLSGELMEVSSHPQFRIINSDLGKMTLIDSRLAGFELVFRSSKITDLFIAGTKMPEPIATQLSDGELAYEQQQQFYGQIKKIYEARGDKVTANKYLAKELNAYKNAAKQENEKAEFINLWLNDKSSYYGQNWPLALRLTLYWSVGLYIIYCFCLGFLPGIPSCDNIVTFGNLTSYYLEFLNPIHKADYIADELLNLNEGDSVSGMARVIEGVSRIIIGFLLYQLVQAFRKHGKSGS